MPAFSVQESLSTTISAYHVDYRSIFHGKPIEERFVLSGLMLFFECAGLGKLSHNFVDLSI
jgi:hypothetical protein